MTDSVFAPYPKILTMGSAGTEHVLDGWVVVEEKVDGSFFMFGATAEGEVVAKSRNRQIDLNEPAGMFQGAIDHVIRMHDFISSYGVAKGGAWFACEYLSKPKHNTLCYDHTPTNGLVLFDVALGNPVRSWFTPAKLRTHASLLEIDSIPVLLQGEASAADIEQLLTTPSYLGRETVEGVVIKAYDTLITLNSQTQPLFVKRVRPAFRERNNKEWQSGSGKSKSEAFVESFASPARWEKAVQHLRDDGHLLGAPQDIGPLIKEIERDVLEEEAENIRTFYYNLHKADILRASRRGFVEWYKERLVQGEIA